MKLRSGVQAFAQLDAARAMVSAAIDVLSDVKDIETLQRANDEAEQRKATLAQSVENLKAEMGRVRDTMAAEQVSHQQALDSQKTATDGVLASMTKAAQKSANEYKAQAQQVIDKARRDADDIVKAAKQDAEATLSAVANKKAELEQLNQSVTSAEERLATLQGQLAAFETQRQQALARLGA